MSDAYAEKRAEYVEPINRQGATRATLLAQRRYPGK